MSDAVERGAHRVAVAVLGDRDLGAEVRRARRVAHDQPQRQAALGQAGRDAPADPAGGARHPDQAHSRGAGI